METPNEVSANLIDTVARVETPEGVLLEFRTAGIALRALAAGVDVALRSLVVIFFSTSLSFFSSLASLELAQFGTGLILLLLFIADWAYGTLFEWIGSGRTPGKRMFELRVVRVDGGAIRFLDAAIRNLLRAVDALPMVTLVPFYAVGLLSCLVTRRQQRIGDLVARTLVVHEPVTRLNRREKLPAGVTPFAWGEIQYQRAPGPRVLLLIERLLRRSRRLPAARAQTLAAILAAPLAQRLGYQAALDNPLLFLQRVFASFADGTSAASPRGNATGARSSSAGEPARAQTRAPDPMSRNAGGAPAPATPGEGP